MSEVMLGSAALVGGSPLEVLFDTEERTVMLWDPQSFQAFTFTEEGAGELAEQILRALTPGQAAGTDAGNG